MEHIIITKLDSDYIRLTPEKGFILYDERTQGRYSIAETHEKNKKYFKAIEINKDK